MQRSPSQGVGTFVIAVLDPGGRPFMTEASTRPRSRISELSHVLRETVSTR
jgi:hypothetical protein